ncbi:unnamed protein product [Rotaria sp. Silwood1]|nr:unnamed protein product [Rotaria sp. Silwood1]CAF1634520.1 unnamed protein product [Rotaria sp. Silwood1]
MATQPYLNQQMLRYHPHLVYYPRLVYYPYPVYYPSNFVQNSCMPANNSQFIILSSIPFVQSPNENMNNYPSELSQDDNCLTYAGGNNSLLSESTVDPERILSTDSISTSSAIAQIPLLMSVKGSLLEQPPYENPALQKSAQHTITDQLTVSTSQPSTAQNMKQLNSYGSTIPSVSTHIRQRKLIPIIDPVSHIPIDVSTQSINPSITELSSSTNIENETYPMKSATTDSVISNIKSTIDKSKTQIQVDSQPEMTIELTDSSNAYIEQSDDTMLAFNEQISSYQPISLSTSSLSTTVSVECITSPSATTIINNDKSQSQAKQRLQYNRDELLCIRDSLTSFPMPKNLPNLKIIINRSNQSKIAGNNITLHDIESLLDKITPQTYDELKRKLQALHIDCYERLKEMVMLVYSKAVNEPASTFLYAYLCKHLENKKVISHNKNDHVVINSFGQILLIHCRKEFENACRQDIEQEKQKAESESVIDKENPKEEEEDFIKAKRRYLGNIIFMGKLYKLKMLHNAVITVCNCIEYLLRDKTNEENLECLYHFLCIIGKKLDDKANIKAGWVACCAKTKPTLVDEICEQHHDQNYDTIISSASSGNSQQQYDDECNSGIKQKSNKNEDKIDNYFNLDTLT